MRWRGGINRRFGVTLDPDREVVTLIGSKEGIAHLPLAFNNPGDLNLATSPAYPVYHIGTMFAGARTHVLPLLKDKQFSAGSGPGLRRSGQTGQNDVF